MDPSLKDESETVSYLWLLYPVWQVRFTLIHTIDYKGEILVGLLFSFFPVLVIFIALSATERDTTQYEMLHFRIWLWLRSFHYWSIKLLLYTTGNFGPEQQQTTSILIHLLSTCIFYRSYRSIKTDIPLLFHMKLFFLCPAHSLLFVSCGSDMFIYKETYTTFRESISL